MTDKTYTGDEQQKKGESKEMKLIIVASGANPKPLPKKAKTKKIRLPSMAVLQSNVKQYIIGQDEAVDRVILAIYRSIKIQNIKTNMLIIGKSGSGKTETMKQIAKFLKLPYTIEDATKYTKEGYVGQDVEDMIYNLYDNSGCNLQKAERGMLIIDEIDKKVSGKYEADISGKDVLNSLLKIVEGTKVFLDAPIPSASPEGPISEYIDTSKMIVVFMGAFEGIEKIRERRLKRGKCSNIGFSKTEKVSQQDMNPRYTKDDLIEFGLPTEFAGRIDTIVEFKQLSKESLAMIAKNSKLSIFRKYEQYFEQNGITLKYDESIFDEIADKAITKNTGAREISNVTNEIFENILSEIFTAPNGKYKECILKKDFVQNPKAYELQ